MFSFLLESEHFLSYLANRYGPRCRCGRTCGSEEENKLNNIRTKIRSKRSIDPFERGGGSGGELGFKSDCRARMLEVQRTVETGSVTYRDATHLKRTMETDH